MSAELGADVDTAEVALALADENCDLRELLELAAADFERLAAELLCRAERLRQQVGAVDAAARGGRAQ